MTNGNFKHVGGSMVEICGTDLVIGLRWCFHVFLLLMKKTVLESESNVVKGFNVEGL